MRENTPLSPILFGKAIGGGGGGSVTPASIVTATGQMTSAQAATTRGNLGAEPEKFVVTVTDDGQDGYTADKTFLEIYTAYNAGKTISIRMFGSESFTSDIFYDADLDDGYITSYLFNETRIGVISCSYTGGFSGGSVWSFSIYAISNETQRDSRNSITITPEDLTVYDCTAAALTSLTITYPPATGSYVIKFNSGSTPTTTTIPSSIHGLESFAAEANTHYEINVEDNYAVVGSWAVSV